MAGIHFLIVEDDYFDMKRICENLEIRFPKSALTCLSTVDAAMRIKNMEHITASFVNLKLDGNSEAGLGVIRHFRGMSSDKPIFVVSGIGNEDLKLKAFMAGATGFLEKDFDSVEGMQVAQTIEERIAAHSKGIKKGAKMKSWKTRLGGSLAGLGTFLWGVPVALSQFPTVALDPSVSKWCILFGILASAAGVFFTGLYARDHHVSDEQAGAGRITPKP